MRQPPLGTDALLEAGYEDKFGPLIKNPPRPAYLMSSADMAEHHRRTGETLVGDEDINIHTQYVRPAP